MVSITLSVTDEIRTKMKIFDEVNWSGFIRKCIAEQLSHLLWKNKILAQLEKEGEITRWSVDLSRCAKKGRAEFLKKQGLL